MELLKDHISTPFVFFLYVNDLKNASNLLDKIKYGDDANVFYTHKNTYCLFSDVNNELSNVNEGFVADKLSLNLE